MIAASCFADKKVALFGLGGSGLITAMALKAGGAEVIAFDDDETSRQRAAAKGIFVQDLREIEFGSLAALILTPGVPLTHPQPHWSVQRALHHGIEIIGDIELFCRERNRHAFGAPFVAITGTNGKSTTTALIAHLLTQSGRDVALGGNIGRPILDLAPADFARVHVIEMSSFQIDLTPSLNPTIGILTNLSPDHLDRHGTMEHYVEVKSRLITRANVAFASCDDPFSASVTSRNGGIWPVSVLRQLERGVDLEKAEIWFSGRAGARTKIADLAGAANLRGLHNSQNAALAAACAFEFGLDSETITSGLRSFEGLPHRMENIGKLDKILFVNDSKATNADSTQKALASFNDIFWIVGGRAKTSGISNLEPWFGQIRKAFLIGEAAAEFAKTLDGKVAYEQCCTIDNALDLALRAAKASSASEPVVLLSPACASYDQFKNFEARGDYFRQLVQTHLNSPH